MSKAKVAVIVDSTAYLPEEIVQQYNIFVIPLIVNWAGASLRDNVDIKPSEFYQRLKTASDMPTTSQPSPGDFKEIYEKAAETAESILCLTISQPLSGTYASAVAARDMVPDIPIEVIDSRTAVMGLGFATLAAARAVADGADLGEAATVARDVAARVRIIFMVDTLEFLHRGGRIGSASRYLGTVLSIKPLLHLEDGKIEPLTRVRTKKKAISQLLQIASDETAGKTGVKVAVVHAGDPAAGEQLYARAQGQLAPDELFMSEISPVIGTHTGPGALALVYYTD